MNPFTAVLASFAVAALAACGESKQPVTQASPTAWQNPCGQRGISYSPVGRIFRMNDVVVKDKRDYGTHVLADASDNIQWVLQSPSVKLDDYAGDRRWYRIEGERSPEHPDLFVVCLVYSE